MQLFTIVTFGFLSDKYGRRPVYIAAAAITAAMAFSFFWLLGTKNQWLICLAFSISSGIGYGGMLATQPAFFAELFGTRARFSGFAFAREIGTLIGGAPVPILSVALVAWMDGRPWGVAIYIILLSLVTAVALFVSPETYRRDIGDIDAKSAASKAPAGQWAEEKSTPATTAP